MDMKCNEVLEQKMCKELEMIQAKYAQNPAQEMSIQDLDKVDKLYHALKSQATYIAMKEAEEYEGDFSGMGGNSGYRGRSSVTGRFVSRDMGSSQNQSYSDGYSQGYSEAMNQMNGNGNGGNSGHYPMMPGYMPRRW